MFLIIFIFELKRKIFLYYITIKKYYYYYNILNITNYCNLL